MPNIFDSFKRGARRTAGESVERGVTMGAVILGCGGVVLSLLYVVGTTGTTWHKVLGTSLAVFAASCLVGAFAGFLFGLPREAPIDAGERRAGRFLMNSNLLKVSDWLTTIIVGLTLVNLNAAGTALGDLALKLGGSLGGDDRAKAFGLGLVLAGFAGSVILMYLWTTVRLRQHLERSEKELEEEADSRGRELAEEFLAGRADDEAIVRAAKRMSRTGLKALVADITTRQQDDRTAELVEVLKRVQNPDSES